MVDQLVGGANGKRGNDGEESENLIGEVNLGFH